MKKEIFRKIWKTTVKAREEEVHIAMLEMHSFLTGRDMTHRDTVFAHLSQCPKCLESLAKMVEAQRDTEFLDIALPQLASSGNVGGFMKIGTEGGKYTIIIHQSLKDPDKGIITVEVAENLKEHLEGTTIILKDCQGTRLVEGRIVNGQVSQRIENIDKIDIQRFKIERR